MASLSDVQLYTDPNEILIKINCMGRMFIGKYKIKYFNVLLTLRYRVLHELVRYRVLISSLITQHCRHHGLMRSSFWTDFLRQVELKIALHFSLFRNGGWCVHSVKLTKSGSLLDA